MKIKSFLLAMLLLTPFTAFADFSGSIGYSSDYMWRGATQSSGAASAHANLEYETNGFYVGAWVGQVDFGDEASLEQDLYMGYNIAVMDDLTVGLGLIQYRYDKGDYDMVEEGFAQLSYKNLELMYFLNTDSEDDYAHIGYNLWFIPYVDVALGYGYHDEDNDFSTLTVGKDVNDFNFNMMIMLDEVFEGQSSDSISFGISYNF